MSIVNSRENSSTPDNTYARPGYRGDIAPIHVRQSLHPGYVSLNGYTYNLTELLDAIVREGSMLDKNDTTYTILP